MRITVEVLSYKGQSPVEQLSATFDQQGGTLGRSPENHLILSDPQKLISRQHAVISYENGSYYLKDTSTTGTFVYNKNLHVHQDRVQLDDGDKLRIGDYELIVCISEAVTSHEEKTSFSWPEPEQQSTIDPYKKKPDGGNKALSSPKHVAPTSDSPPMLVPEIPPDYNFEDLLTGQDSAEEACTSAKPTELPGPPADSRQGVLDNLQENLHVSSNLDSSRTRLDVQANMEPAPGPYTGTPVLTDPTPTQESRAQAYDDLFSVFLEGAGIQDTRFFHQDEIPELLRTAGALLREAITGLGTILRGRAAAKSHMRTSVTTIQAVQNNPLKFSVPDETLKLLLTKNHPGYVDGVEAVREGCADIINHELAMTAGVQAAVIALLERFDPQQFAKHYAEGLVLQRKAKCWDAYRQTYGKVVAEALEDFFGDAFGRAYEEQMGKLHARDLSKSP